MSTVGRAPFDVDRTNTILYCVRWGETVDFYRSVLCLPVAYENEWFVEFALGARAYVSVADAARATIPAGRGAGLTLSWQVADVAAAHAALSARGIAMSPVAPRWGATTSLFTDPEGHRIELWSSTPE